MPEERKTALVFSEAITDPWFRQIRIFLDEQKTKL